MRGHSKRACPESTAATTTTAIAGIAAATATAYNEVFHLAASRNRKRPTCCKCVNLIITGRCNCASRCLDWRPIRRLERRRRIRPVRSDDVLRITAVAIGGVRIQPAHVAEELPFVTAALPPAVSAPRSRAPTAVMFAAPPSLSTTGALRVSKPAAGSAQALPTEFCAKNL